MAIHGFRSRGKSWLYYDNKTRDDNDGLALLRIWGIIYGVRSIEHGDKTPVL